MKFRDWEDFNAEINRYGRAGYVSKKSSYNPFTKVNTMVMEHRTEHDEEIFVLYDDDESYNLDLKNEGFVKQPRRSNNLPDETLHKTLERRDDHRTREHRSDNYPEKPGQSHSKDNTTQTPQLPTHPVIEESKTPKPDPTQTRQTSYPKPTPPQRKDESL